MIFFFEDNSLKEWSFKKAITIQTYSTYHPIPVPLNLLSHFSLWIKWLCHKCRRCKRNPGNSSWTDNNHVSNFVIIATSNLVDQRNNNFCTCLVLR